MDRQRAERQVALRGDLDLASAALVEEELEQAVATGSGTVVVDLAEVRLLDASILGVLVRVSARLAERGDRLAVRNAQGLAARVLSITGLAGEFGIDGR